MAQVLKQTLLAYNASDDNSSPEMKLLLQSKGGLHGSRASGSNSRRRGRP